MLYTVPDYYRQFRCTAGECEDTCCAGWQIAIDQKSLCRYWKEQGDYRKKLYGSIRWIQRVFQQDEEKRCAFLTEDNLCEMYQNLGKDSLCRTCRLYPRHIEEFEGVREVSLSISCPEVAKMLLERTEPVTFLNYEQEGEEELEGFDPFLYSKLLDARSLFMKMVQNRNLPIMNRIMLCRGLALDMQNRVKSRQLFSCDEVFLKYEKQEYFSAAGRKADRYIEDIQRRYAFSQKMFENLHTLELLREDWEIQLEEAEVLLFAKGVRKYGLIQDEFTAWLQEQEILNWDIQCEQLMVYFLFTYFCGAVYDERIFVNVQMAVASVDVIKELLAARWLKNEKTLDIEDVIHVVYRYSREVEHSDKNLKKMWRMLEKQEAWFR